MENYDICVNPLCVSSDALNLNQIYRKILLLLNNAMIITSPFHLAWCVCPGQKTYCSTPIYYKFHFVMPYRTKSFIDQTTIGLIFWYAPFL